MIKAIELRSLAPIVFSTQSRCEYIAPKDINIETVGEKAYGLSALPPNWTLPFFVISKEMLESFSSHGSLTKLATEWAKSIESAAKLAGISLDSTIIVRSNFCVEGIEQRGQYESVVGEFTEIFEKIGLLFCEVLSSKQKNIIFPVLVQQYSQPLQKGHISNERRVSKEARDWQGEDDNYAEFSVSLRNWRKKPNVTPYINIPLQCVSIKNLKKSFEPLCAWAYQQGLRIHFEWIYDGKMLFIVQADREKLSGIDPIKACAAGHRNAEVTPLVLHRLSAEDASIYWQYAKIQNPLLYTQLGLKTAPLYILNDRKEIDLLRQSLISDALINDLKQLLHGSLVIRVDINTDKKELRQMLPRTSEVRSLDDAIVWLQKAAQDLLGQFANYSPMFILHNFIPAFSSAFAYAEPGNRYVMIEALWGIPEGLYYYGHDLYAVDTMSKMVRDPSTEDYKMQKRINYKHHFVCPNPEGIWEVNTVKCPYDWRPAIPKDDWVKTIAYQTRKISEKAGKGLSIMWFVGVDSEVYECNVFPWYHEEYTLENVQSHDNKKKHTFTKSLGNH